MRKSLATLLLVLAGTSGLVAFPAPPAAPGVTVAVVDTGIDATHSRIKNRVIAARDFTGAAGVGQRADNPHGTHVAGVVVRIAPGVRLIDARIIGSVGAKHEQVAAGIRWAADNAEVINLSVFHPTGHKIVHEAVDYAWSKGVIVIACAGNAGPSLFDEDTTGFPGGYDGVVAVGALEEDRKTPAGFTSQGSNVFCAAPGVNVLSAVFDNKEDYGDGTSMAAPWVAGVAALWIAANPQIKKTDRPAAFIRKLRDSCVDLHTPGRDTATGYGLPDIGKVIR